MSWLGMATAPQTPRPIVDRLNAEIHRALDAARRAAEAQGGRQHRDADHAGGDAQADRGRDRQLEAPDRRGQQHQGRVRLSVAGLAPASRGCLTSAPMREATVSRMTRTSRRNLEEIRCCVGNFLRLIAPWACGPAARCERRCVRGRLSDQVGALGRRLSAGRHDRHPGAADGQLPVGEAPPAVRHREQARRRQQHRDRIRDQFAARRLHRLSGQSGERHQRLALQEAAVQLRPRHGAGRRHHAGAECDDRAPERAGKDRRRVHRLRQGQSRQGQHGVVRQRHVGASVGRTVHGDDRREDDARAVPRLEPGAHRHDQRPGAR